jgi:hypothetical protein
MIAAAGAGGVPSSHQPEVERILNKCRFVNGKKMVIVGARILNGRTTLQTSQTLFWLNAILKVRRMAPKFSFFPRLPTSLPIGAVRNVSTKNLG